MSIYNSYKSTPARTASITSFYEQVDGRSAPARRYRDVVHARVEDLGGIDALSAAEKELVRRAGGLIVHGEKLEAQLVRDEPVDVSELCLVANTLGRLFSRVGLKRVPRDITPPNLGDYLSSKKQANAKRTQRRKLIKEAADG
jgi:hypothetical protein